MKKQDQHSFFKTHPRFFGGALLDGKRKSIRPLSKKDSIHFVLKSPWAMGQDSFLASRNKKAIERIIKKFAKKFGVKIYQQAINSNHIHLLLMITHRYLYRAFIKAVSGMIASHVMGQQSFLYFSKSRRLLKSGDGVNDVKARDKKVDKPQGFWQFRPFSRVVNWGLDFKKCTGYLKQNALEALGFISYTPRKNYYRVWLMKTAPVLDHSITS